MVNFNPVQKLVMFAILCLPMWAKSQTSTRHNDGYLTLFKVTSGAALTNTATAIVMEEYNPTGLAQSAPNFSVNVPTASGNIATVSGSATSAGAISRSENGRYIMIPGYNALVGAANTTFTTNGVVRTLNGSGTVGAGMAASVLWFSASNNLRGATSDDGTNYWLSGGTVGIQHTSAPATVTTVSTTTTNTRFVGIYAGQLYYTTASGTSQGVFQVGSGKPTTTGTTSLFGAGNATAAATGFSVSPDGLTVYTLNGANTVVRYTYSGTFSSFTYSGGTWSAASTGFALTAANSIAVDWTGYSFSTGANGAVVYATSATLLVKANDAGTGAMTSSTLRTISGNNAFRGVAFSPIQQTVAKGGNTPAAGNLSVSSTDAPLFQFTLTANEGNSTLKKLVATQTGTASIATSTGADVTTFKLIEDVDNSGTFNAGDNNLASGTVSGSNITFSGISLSSYIVEGANTKFLIVGSVSGSATAGNTVVLSIAGNSTINTIAYTSNVVNAGGSLVTMGTGGNTPTANTLTITGATPSIALSSPTQIGAGTIGIGSLDQVISSFQAAVTVANASLNSLVATTGGSYSSAGAITNFKLYYNSTSNSFAGSIQIGSTQSGVASGATVTFSSLSTAIANGSTGYFFITASVNGSANAGETLNIAANPTLTFALGTPTGSISASGARTFTVVPPTISVANGTIAAASVNQNATNVVLYRADVTVSVIGASLNGAVFNTAAGYLASDLTNLKLWYSTSATFSTGTATTLATKTTLLGPGNQSFGAGGQSFPIGTSYLYVTADLTCTSTVGNSITVNALVPTNLSFALGTPSGAGLTAGGTQTVIAGVTVPSNATLPTAGGSGVSGSMLVNWTAPTGCYDEVMIVAATATNTAVPSGNGSAYTANASYGVGTAIGNGWVVYKGTTSPQTFTGFTDGTNYFFKIYTRYNSTWSAGIEASGASFKIVASTDVIVPQYMQGLNGTNSNRVPSAYRVTLNGLTASATYRYFNQAVISTDAPSSNGAGNPIFAAAGAFFGTSSPALTTPGTTCGTFTTDATGSYTGWFVIEPTGNATRFIPGAQVYMRINMNDGNNGTVVVNRATTSNFATVKNLGATGADATGIRSTTGASPRDFVCLYDNVGGTGRPLSATYVESDGYGNVASYATFYNPGVEGVAGAWGTIVPNTLATGVRRIESRSFSTGAVNCYYNGNSLGVFGAVNTVSPSSGTTPLTILTADNPMNCSNITFDHSTIAQTVNSLMNISTNDNILSNFRLNTALNASTLTQISFTIGGSFVAGDVTNFKLYTASTNTFPGGASLSTVAASTLQGGDVITFGSLAQALTVGDRFFWITADFSANGDSHTVQVPVLGNGAFVLSAAGSIVSNSITAGGLMTLGTPTPLISIASGNIPDGPVNDGDQTALLYRLDVTVSVTTAQLTTLNFATNGTYSVPDISNFKLFYQTSSTFNSGTATLLGTITTLLDNGPHSFTGLSQLFPIGTGYLFITAQLPCATVFNHTIQVASLTGASGLNFTLGSATGTAAIGGILTITPSTPANATSVVATPTGTFGGVSVSWSNPTGCFDEIMIVAASASNTGVPSGDGTAYTANSVYGSGTALGNGFVVYKGNSSPQTITGMLNNANYSFKVFTRNGSNWSSGTQVNATTTLVASMTEVVMPQFIQGANGTNSNRIPFAYRVTINNLLPNAPYLYYNGVIQIAESATSNGAGNVIFTDTSPNWTRSTGPAFTTAGNFGQFTSNASGSYTGWFVTEPTGNATRFTPGTQVYMRIMLNDGAGGTAVASRVTSSSIVTVLNTVNAAGATNGTVITSTSSSALPKNFVCLYDNVAGTGRPISATFVESDGTANTTANSYTAAYNTLNGIAGSWGAIVPNTLPAGVQRIEQRDFTTGAVIGCTATDSDGIWPTGGALANTVDPITGTTAKVISPIDAPLFVTTPTWVLDADNDTHYVAGTETVQCTSPGAGYNTTSTNSGDCDDSDAAKYQSATLYVDGDGDGYDAGTSLVCYGAAIPSGYSATTSGTDCNDSDISKYNSAILYLDADGDGYHASSALTCYGTLPTNYYLTTSGPDCDDANPSRNPGVNELCGNSIDDDCDNNIDEGCSSLYAGDVPSSAVTVSFSSNIVYPNCYPTFGSTQLSSDSPESSTFTGPDVWYKFVAQSTGVSITLTSTTMDDAIALYSKSGSVYTLLDSENSSVGAGDFERLNFNGLTAGQTYYVSLGAASGITGGSFSVCLQHLMPSGCASIQPVGGFPLCSSYKAIARGAVANGVTYNFSFTGTGGGASGTTTLSGTNGLITLNNAALALRYGGIYDVKVDATYALLNSVGATETITINGSTSSANCSGVTISAQPNLEVKSTQRCNAVLSRSTYLIGAAVTGNALLCGALNYTYKFTQVVSCSDGTASGLPIEYTTAGASPYLALGVLPNLPNTGAWDVQIRPNFSYGNGSYGPTQRISVNNTASAMLSETNAMDNAEKSITDVSEMALYPNPNNGTMVNLNISDIKSDNVFVRIIDAMGRMVYSNRYTVDGSLNTIVNFSEPLSSGLYMVEFTIDGEVRTERMMVQK